MSDYNPNPAGHYPFRWTAQAKAAAAAPGQWFDVEVTLTAAQAQRKMERLRAYAKGLRSFPQAEPGLTEKLTEGFDLRFKKVEKPGLHWQWVVYLSFQPCKPDVAELLEKALSGVDSRGGAR